MRLVGRPLLRRLLSSATEPLEKRADVHLFEASDSDTLTQVTAAFRVEENFVSKDDETSLIEEIEPHLKRLRYEKDHWDGAIIGYREIERKHWSKKNQQVIKLVRERCFASDALHLPMVHCLDVAKEGEIKPHVDAVRFCGNTLAGLSLLSTAVMRLALETDPSRWVNILLPRRSVYIMSGPARYKFTHAILAEQESFFKGVHVPRDRRISVMFRVEPDNSHGSEGLG